MQADSEPFGYAAVPPRGTSPLLLIVAWLIVGIPAAWGVTQTAKRSMDLFKSAPGSTVPATSAAPSELPTVPPASR